MKIKLKGESMAFDIKSVEYYYITVEDKVGEGFKLLSVFAGVGVNLLAFEAVPLGPMRTQFTLFPDDGLKMTDGAKKAGLTLDGPHSALLIKGDNDESGALAGIYEKLSQADINVYASNGIADIKGGYGVILYFKQEDYEKAVAALEV
jgi:hypothetical protein